MQQGKRAGAFASGARRLAALAGALALLLAAACGDENAKDPIVFADANWESAEIQTRIVAYIVEHGYGYPTDLISGETVLLFQGLERGAAHIFMEVWLPSLRNAWEAARENGTVFRAGRTLRDNWQGLAIPQHVKDDNPGLVSILDLPDYAHLFTVEGSHGRARFLNCIVGWACEEVNARKFEGYGLSDIVQLVDPGSEAAVAIELRRAADLRQPWFGYLWSPSIASAEVEVYLLEEPPWTQECWETDMACAYPSSTITIGAHVSLRARAPEVVGFLSTWDYDTATHHDLVRWMEEHNASVDDAAIHFLRTQRDVWSTYIPRDIAERVDAALADEG